MRLMCLVTLLVTLALGCGGGSSPTPPVIQTSVTFTPTAASPPANSISLAESSSSSTSVTVTVNATGMTDLYGVGFQLVWNPSILRYQSASQGTHLGSSGGATSFNAELLDTQPGSGQNLDQGRLVVGAGRLGSVPGVNGSGQILRVTLTAVNPGTTGISFEASQAFNSSGNAIGGVQFLGGTATVR